MERFFDKHVPDTLVTVFVPFLTMLVMVPLSLCALAPIGAELGNLLGNFLFSLGNAGGIVSIIAIVVLMAVQHFLVITGMHMALVTLALVAYAQNGVETYALVCNLISNFAVWAMALAVFLKVKDPNEKSVALGAFVSGIVGGVSEPSLFGVGFKYTRCLVGVSIANAVAVLFIGITHVYFYNMGATSILSLLNFIAPDKPMNVVFAAIAGGIGFALSLGINYFFGVTKEQAEAGVEKATA